MFKVFPATYAYLANSPLVEQIAFAPDGTTVMTTTKGCDALNRLTNISTLNPQLSILNSFSYAYNSANQCTAITNVDSSRWVYTYDALGQVTGGKKYWSDGTPVAGQQFEYGFDDIGNRKNTAAGGDSSGAGLRPASYTNNLLNQITSRDVPGYVNVLGSAKTNATVSLWSPQSTAQYAATTRKGEYYRGELPLNNNTGAVWMTITNLAVLNDGSNPDILTNATGNVFVPKTAEVFQYDGDGNLTNDGRWTYTWDAEHRLVRMVANMATGPQQRIDFTFDARGRRIGKKVWNNTAGSGSPVVEQKFVYDGWNLVAILNAQSSILQSFIWGLDLSGSLQGAGGVGGLLLTRNTELGTQNFVAYDGNGNVTALVNAANGAVAANYEYGPFGEALRLTGAMAKANPFRFSTKYQDDETDLLYYGYRSYNPGTGRWLSRDPIEEHGGTGLYAYVNNSPLNIADFMGLCPVEDKWCGMDVTRPVFGALNHMTSTWSSWGYFKRRKACLSLYSPFKDDLNSARFRHAWFMYELARIGYGYWDSDFKDNQYIMRGSPGCRTSVAFLGRCYYAGDVNYLMWGHIHSLCNQEMPGLFTLPQAIAAVIYWKSIENDDPVSHILGAVSFTTAGFTGHYRSSHLLNKRWECRVSQFRSTEQRFKWWWLPNHQPSCAFDDTNPQRP